MPLQSKFSARNILIFLVPVFLCFLFLIPILFSSGKTGVIDWDQNMAWNEFNRVSLLKYKQIPFWNPYRCGGIPHFADPQIGLISIQTPLVLIFGTQTGLKISIFVHLILGFWGAYLLFKKRGISDISSFYISMLFAFNGITASFLWAGMLVFLNFAYIPFVLYFIDKKDIKSLIKAGVIFALSFYYDYHIPLLFSPYIVFQVVRLFYPYGILNIVKKLALFVFVFILFSFPKLILSLELYSNFRRVVENPYGYRIGNLIHNLISPSQPLYELNNGGGLVGADEKSIYLGIIPLLFILFLPLLKRGPKKYIVLILLELIVFVWISMGSKINPSLYEILKIVPFYESLNMAERFRFVFMIPLLMLIGFGFSSFLGGFKGILKPLMAGLIIASTFIDIVIFSRNNFLNNSLVISQKNVGYSGGPYRQIFSENDDYKYFKYSQSWLEHNSDAVQFLKPWSYEYEYLKSEIGVIDCYSPFGGTESVKGANQNGYKGEWYLEKNKGTIKLLFWSPNRVLIKVDMPKKENDVLILNQSYFKGWKILVNGNKVTPESTSGLISVKINENSHVVDFVYNPFLFR